jgi:hypothetical protein
MLIPEMLGEKSDGRKANVFSIKPGINLILLFEGFPIILSICSKHELLSTSSEHDGAQLHPFGKDLFLATLGLKMCVGSLTNHQRPVERNSKCQTRF